MNFLRSVIADARSHWSKPDQSFTPSATIQAKHNDVQRSAFATDSHSLGTAEHRASMHSESPSRDSVTAFTIDPVAQQDGLSKQNVQDAISHTAPQSPSLQPTEKTGLHPDEQSDVLQDSGPSLKPTLAAEALHTDSHAVEDSPGSAKTLDGEDTLLSAPAEQSESVVDEMGHAASFVHKSLHRISPSNKLQADHSDERHSMDMTVAPGMEGSLSEPKRQADPVVGNKGDVASNADEPLEQDSDPKPMHPDQPMEQDNAVNATDTTTPISSTVATPISAASKRDVSPSTGESLGQDSNTEPLYAGQLAEQDSTVNAPHTQAPIPSTVATPISATSKRDVSSNTGKPLEQGSDSEPMDVGQPTEQSSAEIAPYAQTHIVSTDAPSMLEASQGEVNNEETDFSDSNNSDKHTYRKSLTKNTVKTRQEDVGATPFAKQETIQAAAAIKERGQVRRKAAGSTNGVSQNTPGDAMRETPTTSTPEETTQSVPLDTMGHSHRVAPSELEPTMGRSTPLLKPSAITALGSTAESVPEGGSSGRDEPGLRPSSARQQRMQKVIVQQSAIKKAIGQVRGDEVKTRHALTDIDQQTDKQKIKQTSTDEETISQGHTPGKQQRAARVLQPDVHPKVTKGTPPISGKQDSSVSQLAGNKEVAATAVRSESSRPPRSMQQAVKTARPVSASETTRAVAARPFQWPQVPEYAAYQRQAAQKPREKAQEAPKVQIGQIDVIIEAAAQPATPQAPASASTDIASRYYLRRL